MAPEIRSPYIIRMTHMGFDVRFDTGSVDGADISEMFAEILGYPVLYRGVVTDLKEFNAVIRGVDYANDSRRFGRFNPQVLEAVLPNLH